MERAKFMQQRVFRVRPQSAGLVGLMLVLWASLFGFVVYAIWLAMDTGLDPIELARRAPAHAAAFVLAVPLAALSIWAERLRARTARLVLDARGIRLRTDAPRWARLLMTQGDFDFGWDQITIDTRRRRVGVLALRVAGRRRPIALRAAEWVESGPLDAPSLPPRTALRLNPPIEESALWQALQQARLLAPDDDVRGTTPAEFALERHPATRAATVALAAIGIYALIDALAIGENWVEFSAAYLAQHVAVAVLVALACTMWLRRVQAPGRVPPAVAIGLGMLLGIVSGAASYSALLRVNQFAAGALRAETYLRNEQCDTLQPVDGSLPKIELPRSHGDYWCSLDADQRHQILLRRGLFGYDQVDFSPQLEAMRRFYRERP